MVIRTQSHIDQFLFTFLSILTITYRLDTPLLCCYYLDTLTVWKSSLIAGDA